MERTNFEKLQVYQLSEKLADGIWKVVFDWNSFARDTVGKQTVRSADGIGANIAEGSGRGSLQDNHRFIRMARTKHQVQSTKYKFQNAATTKHHQTLRRGAGQRSREF